jgi:hypothetical protein
MKKTAPLLTLFVILILAACAPSASAEAPMYYGDTGGGYYRAGGYGAPAAAPAEAYAEESVAYDNASYQTSPGSDGSATVERLVIKNADLSIAVEDPVASMAAVQKMAEEMGGFVVSSNLYYYTLEGGMEVPRANITIRVPSERFDEALTRIKSGSVQEPLSENITGQDVTQQYTDLQSRLRNLEAAEAQLQEIMDAATKTEDVLTVYNQLVYTREQIEVIKGQIQYYEQSAAMSAITVDILADAAVQPLSIGGWQPAGVAREAIQNLLNALTGIADFLITFFLYILPVALIIFLPLWLIWKGIRKMRSRKAKSPAETAGS